MCERLKLWLRGWCYQIGALRHTRKPHGKPYTFREAWKMGACGRFVIYAQRYGGRCPITGHRISRVK